MNKNSIRIKRIVGVSLLCALTFILQFVIAPIMPKIPIAGGIAINLALIPVVVGAILYGPIGGLIVGLVLGLITLMPGQGAEGFMQSPYLIFLTITLCLAKTGLAGLIAGLLFKIISKQHYVVAVIVSAIIAPIINTGIFLILYGYLMHLLTGGTYFEAYALMIIPTLLAFSAELLINIILSPSIATMILKITRKYKLGFTTDFDQFRQNKEVNKDDSLS